VTGVWLPRFACPECRLSAVSHGARGLACTRCGALFEQRGGVFRFLSPHRSEAAEPFLRQYRLVREREGYRTAAPEYYQKLPCVGRDDPHAERWCLRRESFERLQRHALPDGRHGPVRVLDLGAGSGWLSHRLAASGHLVVAVDRLDDEMDGLGACRHYPVSFAAVQADFDALPFEPAQFDLAIFDGSLHYSPDPEATLAEAMRMLVPGGTVVVMDSPMFARERDGQAMVIDQLRLIETEHGVGAAVQPGVGFLTFAALEQAASRLKLRGRFLRSRGSLGWRLRRPLAWIRLRRQPAAFGVWVAQ